MEYCQQTAKYKGWLNIIMTDVALHPLSAQWPEGAQVHPVPGRLGQAEGPS